MSDKEKLMKITLYDKGYEPCGTFYCDKLVINETFDIQLDSYYKGEGKYTTALKVSLWYKMKINATRMLGRLLVAAEASNTLKLLIGK